MSDDRLYLIHIRECCSKILAYAVGGKDAFLADVKGQDAALRNLQVLAESAKRVTDDLKQAHPEVPWRRVISIRNVLVHDYLGVDLGRIWEIIDREIADLESKVRAILAAKT